MTAALLALAVAALCVTSWQFGQDEARDEVLTLRAQQAQLLVEVVETNLAAAAYREERDHAVRAAADAQRLAEIHHENASFTRTEAVRVLRLVPNNPGA